MEQYYYEITMLKDNLHIDCFVHEILNFRYHWHPDEFELNILLQGNQAFYRGNNVYALEEDDVILIDPNMGHASYGQSSDARALVIHFSSSVIKQFVKKGYTFSFSSCCSNKDDRNTRKYARIRFHAAQLITDLSGNSPYAQFAAKANMEMLITNLLYLFDPQVVPTTMDMDEETQKNLRRTLKFIETNYAEKITLEDIANFTQYNRTYLSTMFKKYIGINFYDYLMRVRFQHALFDLNKTDKNLTDIALSNGFSDLKSFNKMFKEILHKLPSEYRNELDVSKTADAYDTRKYISASDPVVNKKLKEYMQM